jgi:phage replication O-like protein O
MSGNPQIEEGFTRMSNELLEALAKAMAQGIITARERAVVDWVIRYTYGYHQKNGFFHTSFIAKSLGLSASWVSQILKSLEDKKIIIREGEELQINKHYLEWSKYLEQSKYLEPSKHLEQSKQNSVETAKNQGLEQKHLEQSKYLEQSKQNLEPSKYSLEPSKYQEPETPIENRAEGKSKYNIYKDNYINKTTYLPELDFSDSDFSLKEKEKDKDTSIGGGANIHSETEDAELEKKIAKFYAVFEKVMETKYQVGYRVSYRPYAILLVKQYSFEDIERGLRLLKQKMQKENPSNWRNFVKPSSLVKMIDDLLAEQEPKEEEARNYGW